MSLLGDRTFRLSDRYELEEGALYLSGLQALVRIPLDQFRLDQRAGRRTQTLIAGYEGSPLAGYDLEIGRRRTLLEAHGVVHRPSVNEELGANAVQGSQLASASADKTCDGVVGIWYGKAPGLDRATDALRHGNLGGADPGGGVLVMVGDDSVAKSSTVPSSSEVAIAELGMPVLAPADPQDVLDLGLHGIALSRFCGLFTGFKLATNVVDGSASVQVAEDRITIIEPDRTVDGTEFRHEVSANFLQPNLTQLETTQTGARLELARRYAYANGLNRIEGDPAARVGIIAAGISYLDVRQALQLIGIGPDELASSGVRLLKLGMVSPLEPRIVNEFARGLDEIVVVEEKRPFIELALKDLFYGQPDAPVISGRRTPSGTPMLRTAGDLPPDVIAAALAPRIVAHVDQAGVHSWLGRPPAGTADAGAAADHRADPLLLLRAARTTVAPRCRRAAGRGAGSAATRWWPCSARGTVREHPRHHPDGRRGRPVGGHGAVLRRAAPASRTSATARSTTPAAWPSAAAVAAGSNITYKLLYNGAVAMTGGQQAVGKLPVPGVARPLLAEGVRQSSSPPTTRSGTGGVAAAARRRGPAPGRARRGPGGAGGHHGRYGPDPRPAVRHREAAQAQARASSRAAAAGVDQRAGVRGLRRLRRRKSNCLSVQPVDDRVRPQDPDPPALLQQGLLLPGRATAPRS